jgi:4-amino-4-deoxy-L-arabinose transferase-like glycosyltransferase
VLVGLVLGPSLGHDEAAFAIASRGEQPEGMWLYRSDGTVWLARIGTSLGDAAWQVRLASAFVNAGAIVAIYAVGRAAFDARTGAWAAAVLAGGHQMGLPSVELLSDLPATACVLGGIAILIGELQRPEGARWRVVAAGPIFAAGFYIRYGSAPVVAFAIGLALVLWWRAVRARPLPLIAMIASICVLVIPHLIRSHEVTGSYLGILELSREMPRRKYVGEGLVTYLTSNPFTFYGVLVAPVMVAGIVGLVTARKRGGAKRRPPDNDPEPGGSDDPSSGRSKRPEVYLAILAFEQIVVLGLQTHAQPRYVYIATALLVVLGVDYLRRRFPRPFPRLALGAVVAAQVSLVVIAAFYFRAVDDARAPIVEAARAIRAHSGDRPCATVANIVPQLQWHSRCYGNASELIGDRPIRGDGDRYAVWFSKWPMNLDAFLAAQKLRAEPLPTNDERTRVWLLR